ncbi:MAG: hypothetical protein M1820_003139 [Bogoriella megaspora]|nr:MAG: hypothetical protein M1820_003139 [Bogoriella megaspora]
MTATQSEVKCAIAATNGIVTLVVNHDVAIFSLVRTLSKERRAELQLRAKELMLRMGLGINWPSGDPRRADLRSEQGWHGVEILGQGTYGIAALYVRMSQRDRIIDTVVIKENWLASPWQVEFNPSFVWKGPSMWHRPGPPDPDQPLEAHVQELLDNRQKAHGHECFVGMRTWSVYPAIKAYRLYLEYCRHYDLGTLCEDNAERSRTQYKMLDRKDREQALHGAIFEEQKFEARYFAQVPEAFCWFVLQHLATACVQMVNLNTDHSGDEDPNDTKPRVQVIHGDMKTENVFLGESDQTGTWHPSYKIPKLGDFGLSTITDRGDNLNPRLLKLKGTPGWIPPEVMLDDNNKILAETNVFGAALIVLALATNQYHRGHLQPEEDVLVNINAMMRAQTLITFNNQNPDESNNQTPDQANNQTPDQAFQEALVSYLKWIDFRIWRYSPALRSLLRQCLDIDPSRRPSPRQLRDRIDNIIAANNYAQESHAHPLENYKTRQWRERGRYRPDPGYARPAMRL